MPASYLAFSFTVYPRDPGVEILMAQLAEIEFESFLETENGVVGYVQRDLFHQEDLKGVGILNNQDFNISYTSQEIAPQNWNEEWERSFQPIIVADKCVVRAPFHNTIEAPYELIIEPKMSFGTGHHETTYMMLQLLLEIDCRGLRVLDMGCGTAVLAILAQKLGATAIDAIDIDNWCVENSLENCERNNCSGINVMHGDAQLLKTHNVYDLVLANINRNILLQDIPVYGSVLKEGGTLLLSGFYQSDLAAIRDNCLKAGGKYAEHLTRNNWVAAKFVF